eukprot:scaffold74981_cov26-Tisochrysis_lutea.AAC.1
MEGPVFGVEESVPCLLSLLAHPYFLYFHQYLHTQRESGEEGGKEEGERQRERERARERAQERAPMSNTSDFEPLGHIHSSAREMSTRLRPFSHPSVAAALGDPEEATFAVVSHELAALLEDYATALPQARSFSFDVGRVSRGGQEGDTRREVQPALGIGLLKLELPPQMVGRSEGEAPAEIFVLKQELGDPVGTGCGACILSEFVLIARGRSQLQLLKAFCDHLVERADKTEPRTFSISRWNSKSQYWKREQQVKARSLQSVVLPQRVMGDLIEDIDDFTLSETADWYAEHGIPYKRSYLFYGVPGAGKTSLIQALAGKYCRNLCYLSPNDPDMTDDSLKSAFVRAAPKSIIVLEDVDALFGERREAKSNKSPLTFSGLLNALDGVGPGGGQIVILSSNHRERLDPALLRAGRVDKHIYFGFASAEQRAGIFRQFYPKADEALAQQFSVNAASVLGSQNVAMADLQQYFIAQRKSTAEVAASADAVALLVEEIESRSERGLKEEPAKEEQPTGEKNSTAEANALACKHGDRGVSDDRGQSGSSSDSAKHIHIHIN